MARLVWTIEELMLAADLACRNSWRPLEKNDVRVQELSEFLRLAKIHPASERDPEFRSPDSVARKTHNISSKHPSWTRAPSNGGKGDTLVVNKFLADEEAAKIEVRAIRQLLNSGLSRLPTVPIEFDVDLAEAPEGTLLKVQYLKRERSPALRRKKIAFVKGNGGLIDCEICSFNFSKIYGMRGEDFIEVHHKRPLHDSGPTITRLDDLALLCSNCHRMLHRGDWITPTQLAFMMENQRASEEESEN